LWRGLFRGAALLFINENKVWDWKFKAFNRRGRGEEAQRSQRRSRLLSAKKCGGQESLFLGVLPGLWRFTAKKLLTAKGAETGR